MLAVLTSFDIFTIVVFAITVALFVVGLLVSEIARAKHDNLKHKASLLNVGNFCFGFSAFCEFVLLVYHLIILVV